MLFDKLTSETRQKVFLSMNPLEVLPKTVIIQQGDTEASMFYVLEAGACDVLIAADGASKVVHQYKSGRCACRIHIPDSELCVIDHHLHVAALCEIKLVPLLMLGSATRQMVPLAHKKFMAFVLTLGTIGCGQSRAVRPCHHHYRPVLVESQNWIRCPGAASTCILRSMLGSFHHARDSGPS